MTSVTDGLRPATGSVAEFKSDFNIPLTYGDNKLNSIFSFLGPTYNQVTPRAFDAQNRDVYDLEEALKGRKTELETIITGLITSVNNNWLTNEILPWRYTRDLVFEWNEWRFNTPLASRVPNRSVSRLITSSKYRNGASMLRRGIGFEMENDYASTEEGAQHLELNVKSIAQCVQQTQNYDVIRALLICKTYNEMWLEWTGAVPTSFSYIALMTYEVDNFAGACRNPYHLRNLVNRIKRSFRMRGIEPDAIIIPSGMKHFLSIADETTEYAKHQVSGERGQTISEQGPSAFDRFEGCTVYEADPYAGATPEDGGVIQSLHNIYTVGERYMMSLSNICAKSARDYDTCMRTICIDDLNENTFEKVTLETAFRETRIFDGTSGAYSKHLKTLLQEYRNQPEKYSDLSPSDFRNQKRQNPNQELAFMFFSKNGDGQWSLPNYFGKLGPHGFDFEDFSFMAETVLSKIDDCEKDCSPAKQWEDMIDLVRSIESEEYSEDYFADLIRENLNQFELTPVEEFDLFSSTPGEREEDRRRRVGTALREWKPNSFGTLNLPSGPPIDNEVRKYPLFPIGYANGPGIRYLASLNPKRSPWADAITRAKKAKSLFNSIIEILKRIFPTSEMINPMNRRPWFHKPDPLTVFFAHMVADRDPVFLPALKMGRPGEASKDDEGKVIPAPPPKLGASKVPEEVDAATVLQLLRALRDGDADTVRAAIIAHGGCKIPDPKIILVSNTDGSSARSFLDMYETGGEQLRNQLDELAKYFCAEASNATLPFQKEIWNVASRFIYKIASKLPADQLSDLTSFNAKTANEKRDMIKKNQYKGQLSPNPFTEVLEPIFNAASDDNDAVCWLRAPLTMSRALFDSIKSQNAPLVQPSDYTRMHEAPVLLNAGNAERFPDHYVDRPAYYTIDELTTTYFKEFKHMHFVNKYNRILELGREREESGPRKRRTFTSSSQRTKKPKYSTFLASQEEEEESEDSCIEEEEMVSHQLQYQKQARMQPFASVLDTAVLPSPDVPCYEYGKGYKDFTSKTLTMRWVDGYKIRDPVQRAIYWSIMFSQCDHIDHWIRLMTNNVHVPLNVMLLRPSIAFLMAAMIIMKKGLTTGMSVYTAPDFKVGLDVLTKRIMANYTFWAKAIVKNPKAVSIIEHVYPITTMGGCNLHFMQVKEDLHSDIETTIDRPSLIACVVPTTETRYPRFLSLAGRYPEPLFRPEIDGANDVQWSSWEFYDRIWDFRSLLNQPRAMNYETRVIRANFIVCQGTQFNYNPTERKFSYKIPCQGHRGEKGSDPNALKVWMNHDKMFTEYDWTGKYLF